MITFKFDMPGDFAEQMRRELEKKVAESLRREGIYNVTVKVDRKGEAKFSGHDDDLKRVEKVLHKL